MTSKKLGALLRSVPPATVSEMQELAPLTAQTGQSVEPLAILQPVAPEPPAKKPAAAPITDPEVPLQVLIPASIRKQLAIKAAEEGESLRALILRAIRSLGVTVTDAHIQGKRGRKRA